MRPKQYRKYTAEHLAFLQDNYPTMLVPELARAFNEKFGSTCTPNVIKCALSNHKIRCGRQTHKTLGRYTLLTQEQADFVREGYKLHTLKEISEMLHARFDITITEQQLKTFTGNHAIKSGRTGCFPKGNVPPNKGTKGLTGANSGSFKKGNAPRNRRPIGAERFDPEYGYILIKVPAPDPYTPAPTRYRPKHVVIWEELHGPVPKGSVVAFADGDATNFDPENLVCITRAALLQLNRQYADAPAELKPSAIALASLETTIFKRRKADSRRLSEEAKP